MEVSAELDAKESGQELPDHTLYDVAALEDIIEGEVLPVTLKGQPIALVRRGGEVHALGGRCPHKGAKFRGRVHCKSPVHGDVIVCPWHKGVFGVNDGRVKEPVSFAPLPVFPVRVVEGRVLVGVTPFTRKAPTAKMEDSSVLVIGGGAAAASALYTLRDEGFAGKITLIGDEGIPPYDRTALSKGIFLGDPEKVQASLLLNENFYAEHDVVRINGSVKSLNKRARSVLLEDGRSFSAENLLIATGSRPILPEIPGVQLEGVLTLHTQQDAQRIAREITGDQAVILIGNGLTTLETASALRQKGAGVTVIMPDIPVPLEDQWGREVGQTLLKLHTDNGVAFINDASVKEIYGTESVEGVELSDGMKLPCSHVLVSVGNEANCDFMRLDKNAEIKGIAVDEDMKVQAGVYAAGDVAVIRRGGVSCRVEHWRPAQTQGRLAARSILGLPKQAMPMPWYWTQQFGKKIEYLGWGDSFDRVFIEGTLSNFDFMAVYLKGSKVVALVSAGRAADMARAAVDFDTFVAKEINSFLL